MISDSEREILELANAGVSLRYQLFRGASHNGKAGKFNYKYLIEESLFDSLKEKNLIEEVEVGKYRNSQVFEITQSGKDALKEGKK